jgi:hypothetical protein
MFSGFTLTANVFCTVVGGCADTPADFQLRLSEGDEWNVAETIQ